MVFEFLEKADLDTVKTYVDGIKAQLEAKAQQLVSATNTLSGSIDSRIAAQQSLITQQQAIIKAQSAALASVAMSAARAGNYVPLYSWNANGYERVIALKLKYPGVPIIAAINPSSGPGTSKSATIDTAVKAMQAAGVIVLEYIGTNYGSELTKRQFPVNNPWPSDTPRDLASVKQECLNAVNWYGVDGFMFDDYSNKQNITLPDGTVKDVYTSFYVPLFAYVRSLPGIKYVKGNMGTKPLYMPLVDLCDNVCVYEGTSNPTVSQLQNNTLNGQLRSKATVVVYNIANLDTAIMTQGASYAKYYYSSDSGYAAPPTYYEQTINVLSGL